MGALSAIANIPDFPRLRACLAKLVNQLLYRLTAGLVVGIPKGALALIVLLGMVETAQGYGVMIGRLEAHTAPAKNANVRCLYRHTLAAGNRAVKAPDEAEVRLTAPPCIGLLSLGLAGW